MELRRYFLVRLTTTSQFRPVQINNNSGADDLIHSTVYQIACKNSCFHGRFLSTAVYAKLIHQAEKTRVCSIHSSLSVYHTRIKNRQKELEL